AAQPDAAAQAAAAAASLAAAAVTVRFSVAAAVAASAEARSVAVAQPSVAVVAFQPSVVVSVVRDAVALVVERPDPDVAAQPAAGVESRLAFADASRPSVDLAVADPGPVELAFPVSSELSPVAVGRFAARLPARLIQVIMPRR